MHAAAQLIGNLGGDADHFPADDDNKIARTVISIATNRNFRKDGEWDTRTDWFRVVFFGAPADYAAKFRKGEQVFIETHLETREWEQDGKPRNAIEILGDRIKRLSNSRPSPAADEDS